VSEDWIYAFTLTTALGCGVVAGVFFTFSTFVMQGLARTAAPHGIAAMQSINVWALTPVFMTVLFGTGAAVGVLGVAALPSLPQQNSIYLFTASVLYIVGVIFVTIVCNVPRNNKLAKVDPASEEGARMWADYVVTWTRWNHVRTVTALLAAAALSLTL
jgi:uncharacterized membrane protein